MWRSSVAEHRAREISLSDYADLSGDGLWTAAFAAAFEALEEAGGGTLRVPAGDYHSGTIRLRSKTTLYLEEGARIIGSTDLADYETADWGHNEDRTPWHLIQAHDCRQVTIDGAGTIYGSGPSFWEKDPDDPAYEGGFIRAYKDRRPSPMVELVRCRGVTVRGVTLTRSPGWTLHLHDCDDAVVSGITIRNSPWGPNTDGIDLSGVYDCEIAKCSIDTGDDAVCLKTTGDSRDIRNVTVRDCDIRTYCVGLKLGCVESVRDMRRVRFENCRIRESSRLIALYSYRGARIEDVTAVGISGDTRAPLIQNRPIQIEVQLDTPDPAQPDGFVHDPAERPPYIRGVTVEDFHAETDGRIMLVASDGLRLEDIALRGVRLRYPYMYRADLTAAEAASRQFARHAPEARAAQAAIVVDGDVGARLEDISVAWPDSSVQGIPAAWRFEKKFENGSFRSFPVDAEQVAEGGYVLWARGPARLHARNLPDAGFGGRPAQQLDSRVLLETS
jgi:hypothetical protein